MPAADVIAAPKTSLLEPCGECSCALGVHGRSGCSGWRGAPCRCLRYVRVGGGRPAPKPPKLHSCAKCGGTGSLRVMVGGLSMPLDCVEPGCDAPRWWERPQPRR